MNKYTNITENRRVFLDRSFPFAVQGDRVSYPVAAGGTEGPESSRGEKQLSPRKCARKKKVGAEVHQPPTVCVDCGAMTVGGGSCGSCVRAAAEEEITDTGDPRYYMDGDKAVKKPPVKASPKGKLRILGTGTFQKKEHSPRVI